MLVLLFNEFLVSLAPSFWRHFGTTLFRIATLLLWDDHAAGEEPMALAQSGNASSAWIQWDRPTARSFVRARLFTFSDIERQGYSNTSKIAFLNLAEFPVHDHHQREADQLRNEVDFCRLFDCVSEGEELRVTSRISARTTSLVASA